MNPMREIRIEKVTLNIGCGTDQEKLKRAEKLLQLIAEQKPIITKTEKRTTFGMASGKPIGVKVTLRKEKAKAILKNALDALENEIKETQINDGNFSLGIKEYIDMNVKYDPEIGMMGLEVAVTLERPGFRIKRRMKRKNDIGKKHLITKSETIDWLKNSFGVKIFG